MKIENAEVWGFPMAFRGMRNAMDSHDKSDSLYIQDAYDNRMKDVVIKDDRPWVWSMGGKDRDLALRLIKGGGEHRKFLRFIHVQADVTLPLNIWKQLDTYHFKESLSDSTMHTGMKEELTANNFDSCFDYSEYREQIDDLTEKGIKIGLVYGIERNTKAYMINLLNGIRGIYRQEESPEIKSAVFQTWSGLLPDSYLQKRTIDTNYETLLNIYRQRKSHKLIQWHELCGWIEGLPYMQTFLGLTDEE